MSQLNYRASAWLNEGIEPQRHPFGAHSYYVPAQLFPTADGYLALFITHDAFWRSFSAEAGVSGFPTMAERAAQREEVLAVVTAALATDTAKSWEARLRPLGIPAAAVRTLPEALEATPEVVVTAGTSGWWAARSRSRLPARVPTGAAPGRARRGSVVLDRHRLRVRHTLTGEDVPLGHLILIQRVVDPHGRLALDVSRAMQVPQLPASQLNGGDSPARRRSPAGSRSRRAAPKPSAGRAGSSRSPRRSFNVSLVPLRFCFYENTILTIG